MAGVEAVDEVTGQRLEFRAGAVINVAGPWCRDVARAFDRDFPELFRPSIAFNVLLDRKPLSSAALAVAPRKAKSRMYFLVPWKGRILAGTYHASLPDDKADEPPREEWVGLYLADLNAAVPGIDLKPKDILRLHWGRLPSTGPGQASQAERPVVIDHGARGGPEGLFSMSGVKFTTARRVAGKALEAMAVRGHLRLSAPAGDRPAGRQVPGLSVMRQWLRDSPGRAEEFLQNLVREEAALTSEDILLRRTDWGMIPAQADEVVKAVEAVAGLSPGARRGLSSGNKREHKTACAEL